MAECIVGDIAPSDNISKEEKHRREEASDFCTQNTKPLCTIVLSTRRHMWFLLFQEAMRHLTALLPDGLKQEVYGLWEVFCILAVFWGSWIIIGGTR